MQCRVAIGVEILLHMQESPTALYLNILDSLRVVLPPSHKTCNPTVQIFPKIHVILEFSLSFQMDPTNKKNCTFGKPTHPMLYFEGTF